MHILLKIAKWLTVGVLTLLIILAAGSYILYSSADMKQPDLSVSDLQELPLSIADSLRSYGDNTLVLNRQGLWELYVKGTPFERGVAIGRISEDLLYYQEKVFVDEIKKIIPSEKYLKFLRYFLVIFNRNLGEQIPEENREEIYGISLSCTDEFDAIGTPYERQLNYHAAHDIGHMMQAYMLVGCSSFGVWGSESAGSTLIIGRNFDFFVGEEFAKNKVVAFYNPDKGYKFASVCWIGMTGVLSGMNEAGLTVTINASQASIPTGSATPVSILARIILQYASTIDEAYKIAEAHETFVAESLLIGSAKDGKAVIIEKSPDEIGMYQSSSERIVCTNHYQSDVFENDSKNMDNIRTTDSDYRLHRMNELLDRAGKVDHQKAAGILRDTLGLQDKLIGLTNEKSINQFIAHHSVIFKPQELKMWVTTSPWQMGEFVMYDLAEIFGKMDSTKITVSSVDAALSIESDAGLFSGTYANVLDYRRIKDEIGSAMRKGETVDPQVLEIFLQTNAEYYYTYELLGDYYFSQDKPTEALRYWQTALTKEIPRLGDKENIEKKIRKNNRK
ncbi:Acyl-coenzyme A:6-aminopenicillanic acid acyl-transferase [Proteiniphilum saccharofermentans]|uniref:Acyl-coenzyme A:6-aminopenicillanic acid acyl-transferase n=1 Tax=Proteiniphilum saccharofermentans TaxID=1642647 RepID=A0A1R3TAC4_9BACT|nr:C45 family peptidase [Proteiniphilum saccharofermentans]SCD21567.1 Acyl-coenzyme A:6-aminopenicillanic acid acyl-transferase [Proteiniphilum saccharofermentans]